jgi:ribosomal protein L3
MLNDPSVELRRDAVELVLKDAEAKLKSGDKDAAKAAFQKGLNAARDLDQAQAAAKQINSLGENVDLVKHFGYITQWQVLGPFDNTKGKGYTEVFPPEKKLDLSAVTKGKDDKEIRWKAHTTAEPEGNVNLNKALVDAKDVVGYASTVVESPTESVAELRVATKNAVKVWFNGESVYAKEEYHHGKYMDQHVAKVTLKKGRNVILLKVCQNERSEAWMAEWDFQARICDAVGTPIPLTVVSEKNPGNGVEK